MLRDNPGGYIKSFQVKLEESDGRCGNEQATIKRSERVPLDKGRIIKELFDDEAQVGERFAGPCPAHYHDSGDGKNC